MSTSAKVKVEVKPGTPYVRTLVANSKSEKLTNSRLIQAVESGLPVRELRDLQASLAVPMDRLAPMLGISKATLQRRKTGQRLGRAESDRVVRFARLMGMATE